MEDYQELAIVGQGSYGIVYKCKHKITGEIVAVKQLLDEANEQVRKTAIREATILRHLQHPNVVRLLEVFRSKTRIYMVFEYMDRTILRLLERHPRGMPAADVKKILWQLVLALNLLHSQSIIHRDLKPENVLIDEKGVVKLCDFGFARPQTAGGINLSPYVATRWYRAPELLVGDVYGPGVDVWALGCLLVELATGQPLFPGKTNVDQLWLIMKCTGCTKRQISRMHTNTQMAGLRLPTELELIPLQKRFSKFDSASMSLLLACLAPDPHDRPSVASLMDHEYFTLTKQQLATHTAAALKASSVSVAAAAALTSHASTAVVPLSADLRHPPQQQYKLHIHGPPMPQPMPQQLGPLLPGTVSRGVPPPHAGQGPGQHGQQQDYIQQHGPGQGQQGPLLPGTAPWHGQGQQRQLGRGPGQQGPEQGQQGHGHGQGPLLPGTAPRLANQTQQPGQQGQGQQGRLLPQGQRSQAARSVVYDPRPVAYDPRPVREKRG